MPPEPLSWDRKDFFKERKPERSESLGPVARWRDAPHHAPRDFNRWSSATEFRRPQPGHAKQGSWHLFSDDSGHGYVPSRSSEKMLDDEGFRPSFSRGEGRYGRNGRDNRGLYNQRDCKGHAWEASSLSPHTPGRPNDMNNEQRPQDDTMTYSSNPHSDFGSTWDQIQLKDHLDRMGGSNGLGAGQKCDRDNSLGSMDWRPLKWSRSGSMSSRGSGFSHSSSSKSIGAIDSNEAKGESQPKNVTPLQSPSGDATACVTSAAPSEETTSRKKPRLGWGEGLAKYEKKKVDPADVVMNKDGDVCHVGNVEHVQSVSPHLADKSPRLMVLTDCASPATPSSVACSSSPGVEEKSFGKAAGVDNDINLYRSPGPEFQSHQEGFSFKLEKLDYNSLANVSSSLHELLQSDDPSPMDCSTVRPTAMNKLLIWKGDISKVLEVTESEIDLLENELKMLNSDSRDTCQCPAASSSLPVEGSDTSGKEQATAINLVTRPAPLIVCSSGDTDLEKLALGNGEQGESCGLKDQDMDSPGTATSKFVDRLPLLNVASSDIGNSSGCAENQDLVQTVEREAECLTSGKDEEKSDPSVCENSGREIVTPVSNGLGICAGVVDTVCDSIFSSNKETASRASDIFNKLLPKDNCKVDISGLGISSSWKNDSLLKEKFKARKRHLRFMDRVITLKYKAHQQLWKEDVRLLSERKYRPKSHKKYDLGLRNPSNGYQKHRSSIRSRFSTPAGNLSLVPTKEVEKFANKVLCDSQVKLYRNSLKMPALILDKKEKVVTRFVSSNGLIEDPCAVEKERTLINPWTPEEKEAFIEKLAVFGKDFKKIASFFDHKTTADCVEFYYKHHKSAAFQKIKKKPDTSKLGKSAANTYMINPGTKWNREVNAASLDILGAASVMAAQADGSTRNRTGRLILGGYKNMKISQGDDATVERSCSFDVIGDERETAAADVLAGICGSLSSEAVSSCITSSIDPGDGCREWKCQKVDSQARRPLTPDVLQSVDDETCSDDSCGEMDPTDWTDEEKSSFIQAVSSHGKDFAMISRCVRTRSQNQCKVFFSKARKCLGLDLVHPRRGNEGASIVDDANGGESDTEDACVVEAGSGISSDKSGCDMNEDLPLSVMDMDHEKTMNLQCEPLGSVENNVKGEVDLLDKKALRSSDTLEMEDRPKLVFDDLTNIMDVADRLSESVPAQRSEAFSADVDAVIDNVAEKGSLVAESVVGEGMSSDVPKLEGQDERCNTDTSGCGLQVSVHDSNSSGSASDMAAEGSCSGLAAECLQQVSVEFNSMQVNSLLHENLLATAENSAVVEYGKAINQDRLSSTSAKQEDRDKQSSIRGDDVHKHLPGLPVLRNVDPAHVLKGYPLHMAMGKEINGHTSCGNLSEVKHLSKPDGDLTGHKPKDCILQFGNCKPRSSQVDFPLVHQKTERRSDTTKAHSWSSSDTDKPSRNGDVKLFGKILTSTSKSGSSIHENEEKGSHTHNLSNKASNLKFSGHHNLDGNSGVLKFDSSNYAGIENVPRRNYSFWEGNKVQNGHPSFPDSALLLAKYPAAFGNFPTSSSKLEQQPLAVVRNDGHVNGASVFPSREISSSSSSGSGIVDYHQVFSRHRDGGAKVPPFTVDVKQRQDTFDVSRRNGFESVSSLQQQGRGIVGMNGVNVVGRGGIMVGGPCTGVSDPVAAIRMHYAKTEQYGAQGIIREEESWRGKGDIGR
ncbi:PREDICTED: uncharacterized protein LOC101302495 [Fragaria vesca subsp. vesca]|uniref:uncharacterized protein LOC101302495 n=1 Tax=Fragaria vesca subsp. vesca TaxID=101020 RepID=UPI0002C35251|nr:PREDICTED: uncharacterized protein LOC101302495 [Fragaria vesca subsp. vesca]